MMDLIFLAHEQLHHASKREYSDYDDDAFAERPEVHDRHHHGHHHNRHNWSNDDLPSLICLAVVIFFDSM